MFLNRLFVHYIAQPGHAIFLLRDRNNSDEWDFKKSLRGEYFNDYWLFEFFAPVESSEIYYKFALCSLNNNMEPIELLRLEEGEKHTLDFSSVENKEKLIIHQNFWNYPSIINDYTNCIIISDPNLFFLSKQTFFLKGYVMNSDGKPVRNATISCQLSKMKTMLTNEDGFFQLEIPEENESKIYFLNISHSNSMPKLFFFSKDEAKSNIFYLYLSPIVKFNINSGENTVKNITTSGVDVEISFQANSFYDKLGNQYNDVVEVSFVYIDPMDSNQMETFPTFKARAKNYSIQHLEAQAACEIQIRGIQKQELFLHQNAMIIIPVIPSDQNYCLYLLDLVSNTWIQQQEKFVLSSGRVRFPITKSDMFCIARVMDIRTFAGSLPYWRNQQISCRGLSYNSISRTSTDDKGNFNLEIKNEQNVFFEISLMRNGKMENYGPFNPTLNFDSTDLKNKKMSFQDISEKKKFFQTKSDDSKPKPEEEKAPPPEKLLADVKVLIVNLYPDQYGHDPCNLLPALREKGVSVKLIRKPGADFKQKLQQNDIFILISSSTPILNDENITDIVKYYENGGSLYIFGDNAPYFVDANRIADRLFNLQLNGNDNGDQRVPKLANISSGKKTGFDANCPMFYGLDNLYEGNTVSHLIDKNGKNMADQETSEGFQPILWGTQNNLIIACFNGGNKRCIIDGGFTKLYYHWNQESQRYLINAISWLSKII